MAVAVAVAVVMAMTMVVLLLLLLLVLLLGVWRYGFVAVVAVLEWSRGLFCAWAWGGAVRIGFEMLEFASMQPAGCGGYCLVAN